MSQYLRTKLASLVSLNGGSLPVDGGRASLILDHYDLFLRLPTGPGSVEKIFLSDMGVHMVANEYGVKELEPMTAREYNVLFQLWTVYVDTDRPVKNDRLLKLTAESSEESLTELLSSLEMKGYIRLRRKNFQTFSFTLLNPAQKAELLL